MTRASDAEAPPAQANCARTLLCVDDEPDVLRSLVRLFLDDEYQIEMATSGEEALALLDEIGAQVVLSDYRMPGMNGAELLGQVRARHPDAVRIMFSGYAEASVIVESVNEGAVYKFVPKPWDDSDLRVTVKRAFELHETQRKVRELAEELKRKNRKLEETNQELELRVRERTRDLLMHNEALRLAHEMVNELPCSMVGIDAQGTAIFANQHATDVSLQERKALLGSSYQEALPEQLRVMVRAALQTCETQRSGDLSGTVCYPLPNGRGVVLVGPWRRADAARESDHD